MNAPIWAGVAFPDIISRIAQLELSLERSSPANKEPRTAGQDLREVMQKV
jgi:hypothetical protein